MKKIFQLNGTTNVEKITRYKRTTITLNKNSQKVVLSDLKTNDYFWSDIVFDENYVVVYSRGCMINRIPLNIEVAYDLKEERMLDLSNKKIKILLEYMFISKRGFELTEILTFINKKDLQILDEESKGELKRILTIGNDSITDDEVINYILKNYPIFLNYRNLKEPLTVTEYKNIEKEIGQDIFRFHLMPQNLKFIEKENQVVEKQTNGNEDSNYVRNTDENFRTNFPEEKGPTLVKKIKKQ